jgi:hypothetical protein
MIIEIHNMISVGLNVGFELYVKDDDHDFHELGLNLLIFKIVFKWQ